MRMLRLLASTSIALLVGITPSLSSAFTTFPPWIESHLGLAYPIAPNHCTICHTTNAGGIGTVTMPFGVAMKSAGMLTYLSSEAEVDTALDALTAMEVDNDCNHILDTKQLQEGRDPNYPGEYIDGSDKPNPNDDKPPSACSSGPSLPAPVYYGCGAQLAPAVPSPDGSAALVAALVTALGLARTRRRR